MKVSLPLHSGRQKDYGAPGKIMNRRKPPPGLSADLILTDRTETGGGFMPGGADAGLFISRGSLSGSRR